MGPGSGDPPRRPSLSHDGVFDRTPRLRLITALGELPGRFWLTLRLRRDDPGISSAEFEIDSFMRPSAAVELDQGWQMELKPVRDDAVLIAWQPVAVRSDSL